MLAIGALVARITPRGLLVPLGFAFKIRAGDVIEQELELDAEPALVALLQVRTKCFLVRVEPVEAAVEPRIVDAGKRHAKEVFERAVGIPALGHFEFALLAAEAGRGEDACR